ncbi:MAG: iron-sulfur cluster-binding protein [Candidatus Tectomicrobia bacterium]|uniref:Iron-sulfur cluster-binding protein n=1 Tax=Tectimicrobiota bacterium TaxID=2528274 RepID=A0A932I2S2_UNCTE|nr:iron-sulfur cluster-binding protein [Candidatus Tectomicrobia bacterium]
MKSPFNRRAGLALADPQLRQALRTGTGRMGEMRLKAFESAAAPLALRARAREIRRRTFDDLGRHLETLLASLRRAGVEVHAAPDAGAAHRVILDIARRRGATLAVKSKSMASEEIHLNAALERAGVRPVETDLGEWILQLAEETPSHLVAPALHKTLEQVVDLFRRKVDPGAPSDPEALTALARKALRREFLAAGIGISGVNFAIAETGTLCLVTNEGNGRLVTALPKVHIALMGFEKVVPTVEEALTLLAVLPRSATGQKLTTYFTMLTGPRRPGEADGPDEVHLVLLDNGRSRHLGGPFQEAFHCIRCGACQNACPVFQTVGGHTYDSVYGGPIGSILSPMFRGLEASGELAAASSLCGACQEACPVLVDIPRMLIEMRGARVAQRNISRTERLLFRAAAWAMRRPAAWALSFRGLSLLGRVLGPRLKAGWLPGAAGAWARGRELPFPARRSFRDRWRERQRGAGKALSAVPPAASQERTPEGMLDHIRRQAALGEGLAHGHVPSPSGALPEVEIPDPAERFRREFEAVGGGFFRAASIEEAKARLLELASRWKDRPVAVSGGLPLPAAGWLREAGHEVLESAEGDDRGRLDAAGLGVTGCAWAVAETGTLVLPSGAGRPRLHSLLPEAHLALVREEDIVPHLSALGPRIQGAIVGGAGASCVSLITGPSRSADIALTLIRGVHGPREVYAILLPRGVA